MDRIKLGGWIALALLVALAAGWLWGSSRSWPMGARLARAETRLHLTDARARALAARVDLYSLNFGAAAQNLSGAAEAVNRALPLVEDAEDGSARAERLRVALAALEDARQAAGRLDPAAHTSATRALQAISDAARTPAE